MIRFALASVLCMAASLAQAAGFQRIEIPASGALASGGSATAIRSGASADRYKAGKSRLAWRIVPAATPDGRPEIAGTRRPPLSRGRARGNREPPTHDGGKCPGSSLNDGNWRIRLHPTTAFLRFPPVHRTDLEGPPRVDCSRVGVQFEKSPPGRKQTVQKGGSRLAWQNL
jgi:hypothetical protein